MIGKKRMKQRLRLGSRNAGEPHRVLATGRGLDRNLSVGRNAPFGAAGTQAAGVVADLADARKLNSRGGCDRSWLCREQIF